MRILLTVLLLIAAGSASADSTWRNIQGGECGTTVSGNGAECFHEYTNADTDSDVIRVSRYRFDVCFNPDTASEGSATATGKLRTRTTTSTTESVNTWSTVLGVTLTGACTADLCCIYNVPPGQYYWESVTQPGAGETAVVQLRLHE